MKLPAGFTIETWAADVPNARSMALGAKGTLFVGTRTAGKVYAIRSGANGAREALVIASGLNMPNGVAFRDGDLYVGEIHRIVRQKLGAHVAALGLKFYTAGAFPPDYRGSLFIAQHGSWNRSVPIGYRIMRVRLEGNRAAGYEPFATGWLGADGKPTGRPVDLLVLDDGSMLVSDDFAGAIYRVSFRG